jgi:hypothetical protein
MANPLGLLKRIIKKSNERYPRGESIKQIPASLIFYLHRT